MIDELYTKYLQCNGVSIDTRTLQHGDLFFALKGPNFDANKLAGKAVDAGAGLVVIDDPDYAIKGKSFLVDDVLKTLQRLANHHRKQLTIPMIGITGSNGKTTTKELLQAVLAKKYRTYATRGNLNNHIGVPLTLLSTGEDTELAIIEMGANKIGDIKELCEIAEPTHGMITNIGKAHIEGFGSEEGVLRGKTELFDWLKKTGGTVFINSNDPVLFNRVKMFEEPVLFPGKEDFYSCEIERIYPFIKVRTRDGMRIQSRLIGAYNFSNIAAALCFGKYFNVPDKMAKEAIEDYSPENNRSQIIHKGSNMVILDAYNANPDSMEAALQNFDAIEADHKTVVLGDMYELGDITEQEHRKTGRYTLDKGYDRVIFCGERMKYAFEENRSGLYFSTRDELISFIKENPVRNHIILIKGSRAMALEQILDHL